MPKNIIINVGPQKTASSLLYELSRLVGVASTQNKENFYFQLTSEPVLSDFCSLYPSASEYIFDCSPSYFCDSNACLKIQSIVPNATIIIGIRNLKKLYRSYLLHIYSLGLITRSQTESGDFSIELFDPVRYSAHLPDWLDTFKSVHLYDVDMFLDSHEYRLNLFSLIFPLHADSFDELPTNLPRINQAHSYRYGLGNLRRITPYLNILPLGPVLIQLKSALAEVLPKEKLLPEPFLHKPSIIELIKSEELYLSSISHLIL